MSTTRLALLGVLLTSAACGASDPLDAALPLLPPTGGPQVAFAGRLTKDNFDAEKVDGPASQGLPGDYFLRNDKVRVIVQAPGRAIGPCPFGGNVIDVDRVDAPAGDQLGEVSPLMQLGRTLAADSVEVVRDGKQGGPAVLRARGHDAMDDFINLPGVGSFLLGLPDDVRPTVDLKLRAAVTYILMPHETKVRMIYTLYNTDTQHPLKTMWGTISDTGAHIEVFHAFTGFGEAQINDLLSGTPLPLVNYAGLLGDGIAYGLVPLLDDRTQVGIAVPVAGVLAEAYAVTDVGDLFSDNPSLQLAKGGTATREVDLLVGRDIGDITAQAHAARGDATLPLSGGVTGNVAAGARVVALDPTADDAHALITTMTADAQGRFQTALPPGRYRLQAEGEGWLRGPVVEVTLPAMADVQLTVPDAATLNYTIHDRAGAAIPGKVTVVGALAATPDRRFREVLKDNLPYGVVGFADSMTGVSSPGALHDRPVTLAQGKYRVLVSRGPEWSVFDQVIDVGPSGAQVDAVLDHVVPTPGYLAADFHQHTHKSPDSPVPPEDRLVTYLAEGVDFISSSDHDFLFDYGPLIDAAGARGLLDSSVGVETTTWDYGHYIAFPLTPDPMSPNHGALDWAGGEAGLDLPPPAIYEGLRAAGAKVVQVTHPRVAVGDTPSFQESFDRTGLRFDFAGRTFYGDQKLMPVSAYELGLPEGQPLFSEKFDTLELFNGFHLSPDTDGRLVDVKVETIMHDWMNFLSFGFTPTPVGVSDTHEWYSSPAGLPRTLVAVPDDSEAALRAGVKDQIVATLTGTGGVARDVVVTNGPFMQLTVDGAGIGRMVQHTSGPLTIHVGVQSPGWMQVDTVEIFANNTFDVPPPKGATLEMAQPALCFTSRPTPNARCQAAIGGARPLTVKSVVTVAGVASSTRLEISIDVTDVTPEMLVAGQRAGAMGQDLWLMARATGGTALFPVIPIGIDPSIKISDLLAGASLAGTGVPALAFTNAVFVDVDGGGWRAPFQP
jgi:hypothetical protein